jgi:hypothetical protein
MNSRLSLIFIIILFSLNNAFSQCDSDSIVVVYTYENNDNTNIHRYSIVTNAYDLDSSYFTSTSQDCPYGWNWLPPNNPITANYNKYDTILNSSGLPVEIILMQASGAGWIEYSKTIYTYNLNLFKTGDYSLQWNGSTWDTLHYRIWIYDSSDKIISTSYFANGNYHDKTDMTYSNGQLDSVVIYSGNSNTWINNQKFIFYYTGSLRTAADFYRTDSLGNWSFAGQYQYAQNTAGQWVIHIRQIKLTSVQLIHDTLEYEFDTLQNKVQEISYLFSDTISCSYIKINRVFSDSALYTTYTYSEDLVKSGSYWFSYNTAYQDTYAYDPQFRLISHTGSGGCTHSCGTIYTYSYDNYGRIIHSSEHQYTFTTDNFLVNDYYYIDNGQIKIIVPPIEDSLAICPDSSYQPNIIVAGGCGPAHFQWQPSTGLSSDTILQPLISVNDSTTYTIFVHDDYGHSDTAVFSILPFNHNNHLTFANQLCDGSGELTYQHVPASTTYQWYSGSQSVATSTSNKYFATPPGNFWCYANFQLLGPHTFYCKLQSDTFALLAPPTPVLSQSTDTIFVSVPGTSYEWFHESTLLATTTNPFLVVTLSGNYHVTVTDSVGCNRTSNILIVFPGVEEVENMKFNLVENIEMNSVIIINELQSNTFLLTVTDVGGKVCLTKELKGKRNIIGLESISPGIYLFIIKSGDSVYSQKIIRN